MLSQEEELLLLLGRGTIPPELEDRTRTLLEQPLDWARILTLARCELVTPCVYRNLTRLGIEQVPPDVVRDLKQVVMMNTIRTELLVQELAQVLGLLAQAGIRGMPLKGPALASSLYGDPTLRNFY